MWYNNFKKYTKQYKFEKENKYNEFLKTEEAQMQLMYYFRNSINGETWISNELKELSSIKSFYIIEYFNPIDKDLETLSCNTPETCYAYIKVDKNETYIKNIKEDKTLKKIIEKNEHFAIKHFYKGGFICYLDGLYWLSPIQYYEGWIKRLELKNDKGVKEEFTRNHIESPYEQLSKYLTTELKEELNSEGFEGVYFSNKEKFGEWRYEGGYLHSKNMENTLRIFNLKETHPNLFYKLFYLTSKFMKDYIEENPLTMFDIEDEWKNSFI